MICVENIILSTLDSRKSRFGVREVTPQAVKVRGPGVPFLIGNEFGTEEAVVL